MEIKRNSKESGPSRSIELIDKNEKDSTPILMYDAMGTIITICDPLKPLRTKEELAMYTLSSLKTYNPENEAILKKMIQQLGMDEIANTIYTNLSAKGLSPKVIFYAMVDILTEEFCKMIGDPNQELRIEVLLKIHKLADPRIFDFINEYSQKTFHSGISQLLLTQDNAIMQEVYRQMLKEYHLDIITVPNPQLDNLRKNDPALYKKLTTYLKTEPQKIGFYDDTLENLEAAANVGILGQLATGIKNDDPLIIQREASQLVEELFGEQKRKKK